MSERKAQTKHELSAAFEKFNEAKERVQSAQENYVAACKQSGENNTFRL